MSGYYNDNGHGHGRQEAAAAPALNRRGTAAIQRKPIATGASSHTTQPSSSSAAVPQHSLSVSSAGQEGYTVSPASSIHRDRESHNTTEILSPISQGQASQSSPERPPPAVVSSFPQQQQQQWHQQEIGTGNSYGAGVGAGAGADAGIGQQHLLPPLQRQSIIQWPDFARPSWVGLRPSNNENTTRRSDLQQELAEARAREALLGHGPRVVSYGPAPPVEDRVVAPTTFTLPALYAAAPTSNSTSTVNWQPVNPPVAEPNLTLPPQVYHHGSSNNSPQPVQLKGTRDLDTARISEGSANEKTRIDTVTTATNERKRSPFMHYEDIDYFGPEPEETDIDSPDIEMEQEKLKFAEAQFQFGGRDQTGPATLRGKGKLQVTEVGSGVTTPTPAAVANSSPRIVDGSNNNVSGGVGYFHPSTANIPGAAAGAADVLQMGIKARRSWERQQRRQSKKQQRQQQQHLDLPSTSHMATSTLGASRPMNMIMRIPSLISSAGRGGGGSSVVGGGSNDNNSRNGEVAGGTDNGYLRPGEGGFTNNNPYYIHDYQGNSPRHASGGGIRSSYSNSHRNRNSTNGPNTNHPNKPANLESPSSQGGAISPWTPEILWSLLSLATLIAIFLTLRAFDGRSIDKHHWPISPSITLNTLIAFLTAICQLSLLIPITQGLAQLKWNWFARAAPGGVVIPQRERSLGDFALFDNAAFGTGRWGGWPMGAFKLLFSGKGRTLGVGACLVLLTGWLSGPFTQGAVGFRIGEVVVEGGGNVAFVARGDSYFLTSSGRGTIVKREDLSGTSNQFQDPSVSQRRAIQQGIHYYTYSTTAPNTNNNNNSNLSTSASIPLLPPIPPTCSTPSCRFPLFTSLAICMDTADLTSQLSITNMSVSASRTPLATAFNVLGFMPDVVDSGGTGSIRNASLANGAYLLGSPDTCNLNISSPGLLSSGDDRRQVDTLVPVNASLAFMDQPDKLSASIANFFVIYTNRSTTNSGENEKEAIFRAVEVLFHFCVNTYDVSITQGIPTTKVVNSSTSIAEITTANDSTRILHLHDPLSSASSSSQTDGSSGDSTGYMSVNLTATQILQTQLVSLISGTYSSMYGESMKGLTPASEVLGAALFDLDLNSLVSTSSSLAAAKVDNNNNSGEESRLQQRNTIGSFMQNVATSLTNALRASSSSSVSFSSPNTEQQTNPTIQKSEESGAGAGIITGTPLLPTTQIKIHYPPMTFLSVQVFLSVVFLIGIIIQTAVWGVPVLKGSSISTLLAINSGDRAVLEEGEAANRAATATATEKEKEMGRKINRRRHGGHGRRRYDTGNVRLRLVRGASFSSLPGGTTSSPAHNGGRGGGSGWYLDTGGSTGVGTGTGV